MAPALLSILLVALSFLPLEEAALPDRGACTRDLCVAVFVRPADFSDARRSCKADWSGRLLPPDSTAIADISKHLPAGTFWLEQKRDTDPRTCSSVAVSAGSYAQTRGPCGDKLSGYLCQYPLEDPCGEVKAPGGAEVIYTAPMDFEVRGSRWFLQGTTAAVLGPGTPPLLTSKHLCFSKSWLKAPWNCDVMGGGCERGCNKTSNTCTCPEGMRLGDNGVACGCREGLRPRADGEGCEDAHGCGDVGPCAGEGEECVRTEAGAACRCKEGFKREGGACVDARICYECEHMLCEKRDGVYACACNEGFRVRAGEPTKCDRYCTEEACPATCDKNSGGEQCFCPKGYILDQRNTSNTCRDIDECVMERPCQHTCINLLGSHECRCLEGFELYLDSKCLPSAEAGPGSTAAYAPYPTPAGARPPLVPSYVKAGSALGIAVFLLLCAGLLSLLVHSATKRCRRFDLTTLKHSNMDIFHLQQVTTETYKRMSS